MSAQHLISRLFRFLNQPLFVSSVKSPARPRMAGPTSGESGWTTLPPALPESEMPTAPAALPRGPRSAPAPLSAAEPIAVTTPVATTQAMRTLEEVRTDLARLREQTTRRREAARRAHQRHLQGEAQAAAQGEGAAFAPTDFQLPVESPVRRRTASPSGFMPTDFLDIPGSRPS